MNRSHAGNVDSSTSHAHHATQTNTHQSPVSLLVQISDIHISRYDRDRDLSPKKAPTSPSQPQIDQATNPEDVAASCATANGTAGDFGHGRTWSNRARDLEALAQQLLRWVMSLHHSISHAIRLHMLSWDITLLLCIQAHSCVVTILVIMQVCKRTGCILLICWHLSC